MKIYLANFKTKPMDITANFNNALLELDRCIEQGCDAIIYPAGCLIGTQAGILRDAGWFRICCNMKIAEIYRKAAEHGICVVADITDEKTAESRPQIKGISSESFKRMEICGFKTAVAKSRHMFFDSIRDLCHGTDVVFINWMEKGVAGQKYLLTETLKAISEKYGTTFVLNTAGKGYSTHPDFYMQIMGVIQGGEANVFYGFGHDKYCPSVFEIEKPALKYVPEETTQFCGMINSSCDSNTAENLHFREMADFPVCYNQNPLIPANVPEEFYCLDLFDMQCEALANRLTNINCKNVVLNLSGGLDSTMALLVCVNTFDMLGLDRKGLHIFTQPGFGTSRTTKGLAHDLCDGFGLELTTIDITETCRAALLSIGHDGVTADVTFENVQARTRTMNALNLANHLNAIMVGTGDLSEIALGFSTFGGDQIASYNVNSCVSKTVMRTMLGYLVELDKFSCVKEAVINVLTIPVSPELVPHGGEIKQKTEDILAPYKLIDFFIYCTVVTKIPPKGIVFWALQVFKDEFSEEYIREKLKMFYRKFAVGQFKRSCSPECADITHVNLNGENRSFASDGSTDIFLSNM